eukprot:1835794-Rhodomonas_salina.2
MGTVQVQPSVKPLNCPSSTVGEAADRIFAQARWQGACVPHPSPKQPERQRHCGTENGSLGARATRNGGAISWALLPCLLYLDMALLQLGAVALQPAYCKPHLRLPGPPSAC